MCCCARQRWPGIRASRPISWSSWAACGCATWTRSRARCRASATRWRRPLTTRRRTGRCTACWSAKRRATARWTSWSRWRKAAAITTSWSRCTSIGWPRAPTGPSAPEARGRALVEEPTPGETVVAIERVAGSAGRPVEAARLIEAVLPSADPTAARELALRAARLYESAPAQRAAAERLYVRVLDDDPEHVAALAALEAFRRASGDQAGLAEVLERRAAIEIAPTARSERLPAAAGLRESLGDVEGALAAWQKLREAEEGDAVVKTEMARLYEAQGKMTELTDVLAEKARFENEPAARSATLIRLGEVRLQALEDLDGAAEAFREALDSTPDDPRLLGALETIEVRREDWSTLH